MSDIVNSYEQPIRFIIGFAGSGKSTELAKLCMEDATLVLTPTHQACNVLKSKGIHNVFTIHSILRLVPTINQNFRRGQKLQRLQRIGEVDLSLIHRIAIDEFSMISTNILDMLLSALPSDTEVIIFGDSTQLSPVDGQPIEPSMYTSNITRLETQHRANAPDVVETFMRFHHYIEYGTEKNLTIDLPKGTIDNFNPKTDRALAYTNARVIELNTQIANKLGYPNKISDGESILASGMDATFLGNDKGEMPLYPTCISKGILMDSDKLQLAILKTHKDIAKYGTEIPFNKYTIEIEGELYSIHADFDYYATSLKLKSKVEESQHFLVDYHKLPISIHLPTWCKDNPSAKGVKERGWAWGSYLAHQNLVFDVRRPFATTVHKAQGREFSTVYIDQDDIKKSIRKGYYETYARLMYVALSRAINGVIIL